MSMNGTEIKERREALGVSKSALARKASLHVSTVSQIENGHLVPYPGQIAKLEAAFESLEHDCSENAGGE